MNKYTTIPGPSVEKKCQSRQRFYGEGDMEKKTSWHSEEWDARNAGLPLDIIYYTTGLWIKFQRCGNIETHYVELKFS